MATNKFFNSFDHETEQRIFNNLYVEYIQRTGVDVYYIPRTVLKINKTFGEVSKSTFKKSIHIEALLPDFGVTTGDNDIMTKLGLATNHSLHAEIAQSRFFEEVDKHKLDKHKYNRPLEGDLIYIGGGYNTFKNELYEITECIDSDVTWQYGKRFGFNLKLDLFRYSYEEFDTGNLDVDSITKQYSNEKEVNKGVNRDMEDIRDDVITDTDNPFRTF